MSWRYGLVRHKAGGVALHEVYTGRDDDDPERLSWTKDPIDFYVDEDEDPMVIVKMLKQAIKDIERNTIIEPEEEDGGA